MLIAFLFLGFRCVCFGIFSMYDITVFKDSKGNTYSQVTSKSLAGHLKCAVGSIIYSSAQQGLDDADVINKSIESLKGMSGNPNIGVGNILIKRGVYNLGAKGIKVHFQINLAISGEGCDLNLPEQWLNLNPNAVAGTYLIYSGTEKGIDCFYGGDQTFRLNDITVILREEAKFGIDILITRNTRLDRISVIALKPVGQGIRSVTRQGQPSYFTNIIVKGPVEVGFNVPFSDWYTLTNMYIDGFTKVGITYSKSGTSTIGALLRCGKK